MNTDPANPGASSAVPTVQDAPRLRVSTDGNTYLTEHAEGTVWVSERFQERDGSALVWVYYNRFRVEELESRPRREWRTKEETPQQETRPVGDGMCQRFQRVIEEEESVEYAMLLQYYEQRATDVSPEEWKRLVETAPSGAVLDAAADLAGDRNITGAPGPVSRAVASSWSASSGLGWFAVGSSLTFRRIEDLTKAESTGWSPVAKWVTRSEPTGETRTTWKPIGEPFACPPDDAKGGEIIVAPPEQQVSESDAGHSVPPVTTSTPRFSQRAKAITAGTGALGLAVAALVLAGILRGDPSPLVPLPTPTASSAAAAASATGTATPATAVLPASITPAGWCTMVRHYSLAAYPDSPSWVLFGGYAPDTLTPPLSADPGLRFEATVAGTDTGRVSTPVESDGSFVFPMPISSYAIYPMSDAAFMTQDGQRIPVDGLLPSISVGPDETGPTCTGDVPAGWPDASWEHINP